MKGLWAAQEVFKKFLKIKFFAKFIMYFLIFHKTVTKHLNAEEIFAEIWTKLCTYKQLKFLT